MGRVPDALLEVPLVKHLPADLRERFTAFGTERRLERGEILFMEGADAEAMYAVVAGKIKLVRYSPKGKELLLHLVKPGQSFAEAALFGEGTYPATAVALARTSVWVWERERLLRLVAEVPGLGLAMIGSISVWTRRLAQKLELLTQRRVEERFAIYLLGRAGGRELAAGEAIELREPRHLIAAQCGTAPEVLSRTLRRLEEEGILHAEAELIRILEPQRLRDLAEAIE
jgi:CRP/FNR family transcriptional regulator, dissimilatory nitrate respiration regulator